MKGQLGKKLALIQKKRANKCAKFRIFFVQQAEGEKIQPSIHYMYTSCPVTGALWARILL